MVFACPNNIVVMIGVEQPISVAGGWAILRVGVANYMHNLAARLEGKIP